MTVAQWHVAGFVFAYWVVAQVSPHVAAIGIAAVWAEVSAQKAFAATFKMYCVTNHIVSSSAHNQ
ncbi:MAG: hypothetical protein AB2792_20100 [Candidatus Thiodiazotropha sp.]